MEKNIIYFFPVTRLVRRKKGGANSIKTLVVNSTSDNLHRKVNIEKVERHALSGRNKRYTSPMITLCKIMAGIKILVFSRRRKN